MASGHQSTFGSFTTSCLDDIPFKIGSKFLPPQKVLLPPELDLSKPSVSHATDVEYTFEVEEAVLKWSEERDRQIEEQRRYEEERQAALAKQAALAQQAAESAASANEGQNDNQNDEHAGSNSQNSPDYENTRDIYPKPAPRSATNQGQLGYPGQDATNAPLKPYFASVQVPNPLLANISNDILKPVPINQTSDSGPGKKVNSNAKDTSANTFDVSLFEKEDDPFDNLELQTINVLEELKTVLEETSKTSSPSPQMGLEIDGSDNTQFKQVVDSTDNLNIDSAQTSDVDKNIPFYENIDHLKNKTENCDVTTKTDIDLTKLPPVPPRRDLVGRSMPLPPIGGFGVSSETSVGGKTNICNQDVSQSWNGSETTQDTSVQQNDSSHNDLYDNVQLRTQNPIPKPPRHFKYSRHMDDPDTTTHSNTNTEAGVVNILPNTDNGSALGVHFRNTRSNPEIQNLDDGGIVRPRPVPAPRRAKSPPSRPSSGQPLFQPQHQNILSASSDSIYSWNRYSPLPPPPPVSNQLPQSNISPVVSPKPAIPSTSPVVTSSSAVKPSPSLTRPIPVPARPSPSPPARPSPFFNSSSNRVPVKSPEDELYDQLSTEAKTTVDNLVFMGFNKGRVARAVQNLGSDEKEVVEYICLVDQLTEKGHNVYLAETALLLFNNNSNKASSYLELFSQLTELGFNKDKIKEALVKTNNDREQTLDILTTTS